MLVNFFFFILVGSDTDTGASEIEILEGVSTPGRSVPDPDAAAASPSSSSLRVQHVDASPPHIVDHCYARPAAAAGGGSFDHDYAMPAGSGSPRPLSEQDTNKEGSLTPNHLFIMDGASIEYA